jgi:hypothetical protein
LAITDPRLFVRLGQRIGIIEVAPRAWARISACRITGDTGTDAFELKVQRHHELTNDQFSF